MALIPDWPVRRKQLVNDLADALYTAYGLGNLVALDIAEMSVTFVENATAPIVHERLNDLAIAQQTVREIILNITED